MILDMFIYVQMNSLMLANSIGIIKINRESKNYVHIWFSIYQITDCAISKQIRISFQAMQACLSSCLQAETPAEEQDDTPAGASKLGLISQLPLKFKIANTLGLAGLAVKYWAQPRKNQQYTFPRTSLRFIFNDRCHIPFLYFPAANPKLSQIFVYCHGSGSSLNNVYLFASGLAEWYGIAVLAYDYTGDGQSAKQFSSYEQDLRLVLSWVVRQGYSLSRTILCGFSLGSYSALLLEGQMPRLLISPVCGIFSFLEGQAKRFENEKYDTVDKALRLKTKCLVYHCREELVHLSHGQMIFEALRQGNQEEVGFYIITDQDYEHRTAPSYLFSKEGSRAFRNFIASIYSDTMVRPADEKTKNLQRELLEIAFYESYETTEQGKQDSLTTI